MKFKKKQFLPAAIVSAFFFFFSTTCSADVITDWNLISVNATKAGGLNSNLATRIEAIEAIAVYDAVNSVRQFGVPYHYFAYPPGEASAQAAAAQAAHDVLVNFFPNQKGFLDSALDKSLKAITDGPIGYGQTTGAAAAADIIALRLHDGSSPDSSYAGPANPGAGQYRPTPAGFKSGINVEWGNVKPFLLLSAKQFLPTPPPPINSDIYKKALGKVDSLGAANSTIRTADQTHIAQFYKQDAELTVNEAARELAIAHHISLEDNALIFVLTDIAAADARIEVWGGKYTYLFWRPVTALNANADGSVTNNYSKWTPLISTPAHPSYPSGHSGTVTAGFEVLKHFFGDKDTFELHTTTPGEPTRKLSSLSLGEFENGMSRIYGGIHYPFENDAAQKIGRQVAAYVLAHGPKRKPALK